MQKLVSACLLLIVLAVLQTKAFAGALNCKFKNSTVENIQTIQLKDESLIINQELEIPLEKNKVKCGNFGRQDRFDGNALGYQVILKSCSEEAKLAGHLIDSRLEQVAEVVCDEIL